MRTLLPLLVALMTTAWVYRPVSSFEFVNFDDEAYVRDNERVTTGLTPSNLGWALTAAREQVWIPATWVSFQLDASLFGPGPRGFHRTNLVLHLVNVVLVWALCRRFVGGAWISAFAAALFGVHPINVEAVAWITARKDVLMAPLLLGATLAWHWTPGRPRSLLAFALALAAMLAKPAAVVAPFLVVLVATLDTRAGGRTLATRAFPRARDRALLAGLAAAAVAVALVAVTLARHGEMGVPDALTPLRRLSATLGGLAHHLVKIAWPRDLAICYPEESLAKPAVVMAAAAFAVLALSIGSLRIRRRIPALALGWFWFLLCVLPSSRLVSGGQLPAGDRYVYVAAIGLVLALSCLLARLAVRGRAMTLLAGAMAALILAGCGIVAARQVETWRSSEVLWRHALAATGRNGVAHQNLAVVLDASGRSEEALRHLEQSIAIEPRSEAHFNAGNICGRLGRSQDAETHYRAALRLNPALVEASLNLGSLLGAAGRPHEAREVLLSAAERAPGSASIQFNLAVLAWMTGNGLEAQSRCERALAIDPAHGRARELLGIIRGSGAAPDK